MPGRLLTLAIRLHVVAGFEVLVYDLSLERAHSFKRYRAPVVHRGLCGLIPRCAQRDRATVAVSGRVDDHLLALAVPAESDSVGEVLNRVDCLAMVTDQQAEILPDEPALDALGILMHLDRGRGANVVEDSFHQLSDA